METFWIRRDLTRQQTYIKAVGCTEFLNSNGAVTEIRLKTGINDLNQVEYFVVSLRHWYNQVSLIVNNLHTHDLSTARLSSLVKSNSQNIAPLIGHLSVQA